MRTENFLIRKAKLRKAVLCTVYLYCLYYNAQLVYGCDWLKESSTLSLADLRLPFHSGVCFILGIIKLQAYVTLNYVIVSLG